MLKFFDILALLLYCAVIFWLSDQPSLPLPMLFEYQDKLHHFSAYFIMSVLTWRSFRHLTLNAARLPAFVVLFCSLYGVSDEWHQSFVEGRTADGLDWLADTLGAGAAVLLLARFFQHQQKSR